MGGERRPSDGGAGEARATGHDGRSRPRVDRPDEGAVRRPSRRAVEPRRESPRDPSRVACSHFPDCVGCPLVGSTYGEQLRGKEATLASELGRWPSLAQVSPERIFGSPLPFGYRNQAKLVLRRRRSREGRSEVVLGVYRPGTHSVMPAERCRVHDRRLLPFLVGLRARIEESGLPIFDERSREGALRYALARISTESGAIHLTLVSAVADLPGLDRLVERIRRDEPRLEAAFLCVNSSPGNAILSPDVRRLFGPKALLERFGRLVLGAQPVRARRVRPGAAADALRRGGGHAAARGADHPEAVLQPEQRRVHGDGGEGRPGRADGLGVPRGRLGPRRGDVPDGGHWPRGGGTGLPGHPAALLQRRRGEPVVRG